MDFLAQKEEGIQNVFEEGKEKIALFTKTADYGKVLSGLVISAGISLGGGSLIVQVLKSDSSKLNSEWATVNLITCLFWLNFPRHATIST